MSKSSVKKDFISQKRFHQSKKSISHKKGFPQEVINSSTQFENLNNQIRIYGTYLFISLPEMQILFKKFKFRDFINGNVYCNVYVLYVHMYHNVYVTYVPVLGF